MIKIMGFSARPGATKLLDLMGPGIPLAPVDAGPLGTIVSVVSERTLGTMDATAWVEQWWPDEATFRAWQETQEVPARATPRPDTFWLTIEHVLRTPRVGVGGIKLLGTAYRRADFTTDAFFRYWRDIHGPISGVAPGLGGYVVTEVVRRLAGEAEADGFVEQWWPDAETLATANASPEVAVAWEDVANYALTTGTFWLTREEVLAAPSFPNGSLRGDA